MESTILVQSGGAKMAGQCENGKNLKTQKQALKARKITILNARIEVKQKQEIDGRTFKDEK